jgi:hypothetical protein
MFRKLMVLVLILAAVGVMCIPYVQAATLQEIETTIEGYYQTILLRASDAAGKKNWVDHAVRGMSLENIKKAFYNSPEFKALAEKKVEEFYTTILGRAPEASGKKYWVDIAIKGTSFADIKQGFYTSPEFKALAEKKIEEFYTTILGRTPETSGKKYWVEKAVGGMSFAEIKKGFYTSPEFKALAEKTIEGFYTSILGRTPEASGKKYWVEKAVGGMSFADIKKGFYNSPEFKALAEKKIEGFYTSILGRTPEASGKKYWVDIAIKGASFADIKKGFYNSVEFRGIADKTIEGFYKSILKRSSDDAGKKFWVEKAVGGMSFKDIKKAFYASEEYKNSQKGKVKMTSDMRTGSSTILPK